MNTASIQVLRPRSVAAKLGVSLATVWRWSKDLPDFPKPFPIGPKSTGFDASEVDAFIERRKDDANTVGGRI